MTQVITYFASESESGIGALGLDGKALIIQLITFILAYLVLRRFAFTPILRVLQERRELIESGLNLGEKMKHEQQELDKQVEQTLATARAEADEIIAAAEATSKSTLRTAEEKAREKAANMLEEAQERIVSETDRARKKLEAEIVGLVSDATEVIIGEKVDADKDAELIGRALKERQAA